MGTSRRTFLGVVLVAWVAAPSVGRGQDALEAPLPQGDAPVSESAAPPEPGPEITESAPDEELTGLSSLETEVLLNAPVVTATGREVSRALAPANIVTFEREEIERHGWTTLADVLAHTTGLYVIDNLVTPSVSVRGVGGGLRGGTRVVRIMINGQPVSFRSDLTAFLGPEYIPMDAVERVEIAKGPLSALYGANAFLAAVNVITRAPVEGVQAQLVGEARGIAGNTTFGGAGNVAYASEEVSLLAAVTLATLDRSGLALRRSFDGQDAAAPAYAFLAEGDSERDTSTPRSAFLSGELRLDRVGVFRVQGGRQALRSKAEFQPASVLTHGSRVVLQNDWASATYIYGYGADLSLIATAGFSRGEPTSEDRLVATAAPGFSYRRVFGYSAIEGGLAVEATLPRSLELKIGLDYDSETHEALYYVRRDEVSRTFVIPSQPPALEEDLANVGAYLQLGGNPLGALPELFLSANARYDDPSLFAAQASWRLGAAYQWTPRVVSKLFAGRAFQSPSAVQLFAHPGFGAELNVIGDRVQTGHPLLEPQSVLSLELANTWAFTNELVLDAALWHQGVRDAIEFVAEGSDFRAANGGGRSHSGAEVGVRASAARISGYVSASAQTRGGEFEAPPEFPLWQAVGGAAARFPEAFLVVDVAARLVGERGASEINVTANNGERYTLGGYATFDLTLSSLDLFLLGERAETRATLSVRNLLGSDYLQPGHGRFDLPNVGRTFLFRLSQSL